MSETSGISKLAGRAGTLMTVIGLAVYFFGLFGPVRNVIFVGVALIALSFAAYFVEEFGPRS